MTLKRVPIEKIRRGSIIYCGEEYGFQEAVHIYKTEEGGEIIMMSGLRMVLKPNDLVERVKY